MHGICIACCLLVASGILNSTWRVFGQGANSPSRGWNEMESVGTGGWGASSSRSIREEFRTAESMYQSVIGGVGLTTTGIVAGTSALFSYIGLRDSTSQSTYDMASTLDYLLQVGTQCAVDRTQCMHGFAHYSNNCTCICHDQWIGPACDSHTCFNNGDYADGRCTCRVVDGHVYDPDAYCGVELRATTYKATESSCPSGFFGSSCEFSCVGPEISTVLCPTRDNWAQDECIPYGTGKYACICGGGFSLVDKTRVHINYLVCDSAEQCHHIFFERDARSLLCAPDIDAAPISTRICDITDMTCCLEYSRFPQICSVSGCTFNGLYCVSKELGVSSARSAVWASVTYRCTSNQLMSVCNHIYRGTYLKLYRDCDLYNMSCLRAARLLHDRTTYAYASAYGWLFGSSRFFLIARTMDALTFEYLWFDGSWRTSKPLIEYIQSLPIDSGHAEPRIVYTVMDSRQHIWCVSFNQQDYDGATAGVVGWFDLNYYSSSTRSLTLDPYIQCIHNMPKIYNGFTYFIDSLTI
jgi:hypothetical protein